MTMIKTTHQPHRAHNRNHRASRLALNEALGGQNEPYHHEAQWVILRHGKIQGPFGTAEVIDKISHLQVGPRDALWRPSQTGWQSVENFVKCLKPELRHHIHQSHQRRRRAQMAKKSLKPASGRQAESPSLAACSATAKPKPLTRAQVDIPAEAAGEDAVAARLRRCAMPVLSS